MIKYRKYGYWYKYWDTYDIKYASKNRKIQWYEKNIKELIYKN